jgi:hypothetical protein
MASPKKQAAKKSGPKRKASAAACLDSAAPLSSRAVVSKIEIEGSAPKAIAKSLLSLLPSAATKQHADAKKLLKAFPLVLTELEQRAVVMAKKNETLGNSMPIVFRLDEGKGITEINVPEDSFVNMFSFLKGSEIVKVSTVSKSWLSVSRMPSLWTRLDSESSGLTNSSKQLNATGLIKLIGRPQVRRIDYSEIVICFRFCHIVLTMTPGIIFLFSSVCQSKASHHSVQNQVGGFDLQGVPSPRIA